MAHQITSTDAFGYVGRKAWHGLGMELRQGMTATESLQELRLDWQTELRETSTMGNDGQRIRLPNTYANVRTDTDEVLGVVTRRYVDVQNSAMAEFADSLCGLDAAARIETMGSLKGGRVAYALMRQPEVIRVHQGDDTYAYALVAWGHDGTTGITLTPTYVRVVCSNTLSLAMGRFSHEKGVRIAHFGDVRAKLDQAKRLLDLSKEHHQRFASQVQLLGDATMGTQELLKLFARCFRWEFGARPDDAALSKAWDARYDKIVGDWMVRAINDKQSAFGGQGTAWAALNAMTEWADHARGSRLSADSKLHSRLFGTGAALKQQMWQASLEAIGVQA